MTLIKYRRPGSDLMSKNFSDIMDEFFNDAVQSGWNNSFSPGVDISETEDQFLITAELPGMKKEDIDISLENNRLTISGERKFEKEENGKTFHRVETRYGSFNRSFQLPDSVDSETVKATYNDGLLEISINKSEDKVQKKIEIS